MEEKQHGGVTRFSVTAEQLSNFLFSFRFCQNRKTLMLILCDSAEANGLSANSFSSQ